MQTKRTVTGVEPILLADAKLFLRTDYTTDDTLITRLILSARERAEKFCNCSFVAQSIELSHDLEDDETKITLPYPNHLSIEEVKVDGVVSGYTKTGLNRFTIQLAEQGTGELTVKYKASGECPEGVKSAIYDIIKESYDNRSEMPMNENAMVKLTPYKIYY